MEPSCLCDCKMKEVVGVDQISSQEWDRGKEGSLRVNPGNMGQGEKSVVEQRILEQEHLVSVEGAKKAALPRVT